MIGTTLTERYEVLFEMLIKAEKEIGKIGSVIGNEEVICLFFETSSSGYFPVKEITKSGDVSYVGDVALKLCFKCHKSRAIRVNELILCGENDNAVIIFENLI